MFNTADDFREYLESLSFEELLGEDFLDAEAEDEIESRLDAIRNDLESMPYEELLGQELLEDLTAVEIDIRLNDFEEEANHE